MSIIELTGRGPDSGCLHCVLPPIIDRFTKEHPRKPSAHTILEIAQVLGELIASGLYNDCQQHLFPQVVERVHHQIDESAKSLLAELSRKTQ